MIKKSEIFYSDLYLNVQKEIVEFLNSQPDFLSVHTANSPRAVGDAIESILCAGLKDILGDTIKDYSEKFARRAMADLAFTDNDDLYYMVDVKTHRLDTGFNMPNITSVERLARYYEDNSNYFVILKIDYTVDSTKISISRAVFVPIEFLSWECLTIGALGWGQIQIANANNVVIKPQYSRKSWMMELCDALFEFYPREIAKINERIERFQKVRSYWEARGN